MVTGIKIIVGPPGTGKTTRLIDVMEDEMSKGVEPEEIAYVSFTRRAAQVATTRCIENFLLQKDDFTWVRTIHSMAYRVNGFTRSQMMKTEDYQELGRLLSLTFTLKHEWSREALVIQDSDNGLYNRESGDLFLFIYGFARARGITFRQAWDILYADENSGWFEFKRFTDTYIEYKQDNGLIDFSDLLLTDPEPIDIKVAIIDEAQDLSTAQWQFVMKLFRNAHRIYVAGDDDQSIFAWSGADARYFTTLPGEVEILPQSYRIPKAVHKIAEEIGSRISNRLPKQYIPRQEEGVVDFHYNANYLDLSNGTWLLLARNKMYLDDLKAECRDQGIPYTFMGVPSVDRRDIKAIKLWEGQRRGGKLSEEEKKVVQKYLPPDCGDSWPAKDKIWHEALTGIPYHDREYYISLLRRGHNLLKTPPVTISTIHGVKGEEADNVALLCDITSRTHETMERSPDSEHRVWYVGVTRCKESLHIILPHRQFGYQI